MTESHPTAHLVGFKAPSVHQHHHQKRQSENVPLTSQERLAAIKNATKIAGATTAHQRSDATYTDTRTAPPHTEKSYLVFAKGVLAPASALKDDYAQEILTFVKSPFYHRVAHHCIAAIETGALDFKKFKKENLLHKLLDFHKTPLKEDVKNKSTDKDFSSNDLYNNDLDNNMALVSKWAAVLKPLTVRQTGRLLNVFRQYNTAVAIESLNSKIEALNNNTIQDREEFNAFWKTFSPSQQAYWQMLPPVESNISIPEEDRLLEGEALAFTRMSRTKFLNELHCTQGLSIRKLESLVRETGCRLNIALTTPNKIHARLAFHLSYAQIVQLAQRITEIKYRTDKVAAPRPFTLWAERHIHPVNLVNWILRPNHSFIVTAAPGKPASSIISSLGNRAGKLSTVDQTDPEHQMHHFFGAMDKNGWRFGQTQKGKIAFLELPFDPDIVKDASQNIITAQDINDVSELKKFSKRLKKVHKGRVLDNKFVNKLKVLLIRIENKDNGQYRNLLPKLRNLVNRLEQQVNTKLDAHITQATKETIKTLKEAIALNNSLPNFGLINGPTCQTFSTIAIHYLAKRHREENNDYHAGEGKKCTGLTVRKAIEQARKAKPNAASQSSTSSDKAININDINQGAKIILRGLLPVSDDETMASEVMRLSRNAAWGNKLSCGKFQEQSEHMPELLKMIADPKVVIRDICETAPYETLRSVSSGAPTPHSYNNS